MQKWDVVRIYCDFLDNPHDKFCICICNQSHRFYFINSEPPQFRRARELAISIENYEALFLDHTSYVDTTKLLTISEERVVAAWTDEGRRHGILAPFLKKRIVEGALSHDVLLPEERALITNGENLPA